MILFYTEQTRLLEGPNKTGIHCLSKEEGCKIITLCFSVLREKWKVLWTWYWFQTPKIIITPLHNNRVWWTYMFTWTHSPWWCPFVLLPGRARNLRLWWGLSGRWWFWNWRWSTDIFGNYHLFPVFPFFNHQSNEWAQPYIFSTFLNLYFKKKMVGIGKHRVTQNH